MSSEKVIHPSRLSSYVQWDAPRESEVEVGATNGPDQTGLLSTVPSHLPATALLEHISDWQMLVKAKPRQYHSRDVITVIFSERDRVW